MASIGNKKQRLKYDPDKRSQQSIKMHGLTLEQYENILKSQNGVCAICKSSDSKTKGIGRFCVDHDHLTGEIRGLLCASCNRGIGLLGDKVELLKNAIKYLEKK
jgi:hypothetical protein